MIRARIQIENRIEDMGFVAAKLETFGQDNRLPPPVINDLHVALDEVLNNVISYGYADAAAHTIDIDLSYDGAHVTAVISDDAAPFDPLQVPAPQPASGLKTRRIGGLGIHLVRNLMDQCSYARSNGRNQLTLRKHVT